MPEDLTAALRAEHQAWQAYRDALGRVDYEHERRLALDRAWEAAKVVNQLEDVERE